MFSLVLSLIVSQSFAYETRIIHGGTAQPADYSEVVLLNGAKKCTATLIGPRTIVTAAKCVGVSPQATFDVGGVTYNVQMTKSPNISKLHDMALGLVDKKVPNVKFAYIGKAPSNDLRVKLAGYGCAVEGGGDSDLTLRVGETKITGIAGFDFTTQETNGATICPGGDEGGPAFVVDGKHWIVGINRTSNLRDKNYHISLQADESKTFLQSFQTADSPICGIAANCEGSDPDPAPTCTLTASPSSIQKGKSLTLSLEVASGVAASATLDNVAVVPPVQKIITPAAVGDFTSTAVVKGANGTSSTCSATYKVTNSTDPDPQAPSCRLTASPRSIKPNQTVTLTLKTFGTVTSAKIDEQPVSPQGGTKVLTGAKTAQKGIFTSAGLVMGPTGAAVCSAYYEVSDGGPVPTLPNFTVIATICGDNTLTNSAIARVCVGTLKKDDSVGDLKISDAVQLSYKNNTEEVLTVMGKIRKPKFTSTIFEELWMFYSNRFLSTGNQLELDTRTGTASVDSADGSIVKLSGKSATGELFVVENLTPVFTKRKP